MAIAYLNATKLSVRQMKRPLSHPHLTVHAQQIEIEVIHSRGAASGDIFCTASGGTSKDLELKGKFLECLRQLS